MFGSSLKIAIRFTLCTTLLLGLAYPLLVTGFAQLVLRHQANGGLVSRDGTVIGSQLIGQNFSSEKYFHSRPSAAGNGYDASNSSGSNLAASSQKLVTRIQGDVAKASTDNPSQPVPIDLVTASASGLDPDITPAAANYQIHRIAQARKLSDDAVAKLVSTHITPRQFGFLGEPRVNVLELNLALDEMSKTTQE
ncbi:Potassium-transporting ATPase C chain [Acidisarcina polymorpha]|uniref:Potassium-transporting ATPase KdpC subunit n=1 Tax=Acidisarcina polymorpha TaxID=2211140 RepID=A0A2Z5G9F2_9BACT|nr:potassium-transporting ATPase subunit KdpC [Acidisarcina polymorpha]AXC15176.1 Potassium-transporting ATPase C chain [Acidisarcina polymorpha]